MRTLNFKRCLLGLALLLILFLVSVVSFVYFANLNDYSSWVSAQIKKTSGYDVRFEGMENNWGRDKRLSIVGLSLYQQQQRVAFIGRLDINVDKVNLWQRQLEIRSIDVDTVDINIQPLLALSGVNLKTPPAAIETKNRFATLKNINWERLNIATVNIKNLNITGQDNDKKINLVQANLTFNELLIINHKQWQILPANIDFTATFKALQLSDSSNKVEVNKFNLTAAGSLFKRKGHLNISAAEMNSSSTNLPPLKLNGLQLQLLLEQQKLSLQHFFVNAFSGSLALKAEALLTFNLLPKPAIKVQEVELLSLLAKDMQIHIAKWKKPIAEPQEVSENRLWPIEKLSIAKAHLQNINIDSEAEQLPLRLKSAHVQINDWLLIQDSQLLDPTLGKLQTGGIVLAFDSMHWKNSVIDKFSMGASLNKEQQPLNFLQQILITE